MIIEYDNNKYNVVKEEKLSEHHGTYRVIQYDTGYYAMQLKTNDKHGLDVWNTLFVCPLLDYYDGSDVPYGKLYLYNL